MEILKEFWHYVLNYIRLNVVFSFYKYVEAFDTHNYDGVPKPQKLIKMAKFKSPRLWRRVNWWLVYHHHYENLKLRTFNLLLHEYHAL
jgi:hypothetical protein